MLEHSLGSEQPAYLRSRAIPATTCTRLLRHWHGMAFMMHRTTIQRPVRSRTTWLRNRASEVLIRFWLGHADKTVTDGYSKLKDDLVFRQLCAVNVGLRLSFHPRKEKKNPMLHELHGTLRAKKHCRLRPK